MPLPPGRTALRWSRIGNSAARLAVIAGYFAAWWCIYGHMNAHGADPVRTVHLTRPADLIPGIIQPWTAVVYLLGGIVLPLLPFIYNWSWPRLRFVLACYAITTSLAFACYWLWPVSIIRPAYEGPGLGQWLMREVVAIDRPANCFPSSHVFYAVLGALLLARTGASRLVRLMTWALAVVVSVTTVTTGQHYFLDAAGGVAVALLGYAIARYLLPKNPEDGAAPKRAQPTGVATCRGAPSTSC
jgi:membrane-associated phospholipid phosphatase